METESQLMPLCFGVYHWDRVMAVMESWQGRLQQIGARLFCFHLGFSDDENSQVSMQRMYVDDGVLGVLTLTVDLSARV